jgi:predicted NUDIX family NTP pyrophosphohydrolase
MAKKSAGVLLFRRHGDHLEVLLVHPGGPFWAKRDEGAWTVPKGEFGDDEEPLAAALREFKEETGVELSGLSIALDPVRQSGGKVVYAFAIEGNIDASKIQSNTFMLEWPPKSGKLREFPEVDEARWFSLEEAEIKINKAQVALLRQLKQPTRSTR